MLPLACTDIWNDAIGAEYEALVRALETSPPVSIRLHPQKQKRLPDYPERVAWCPTGRYLEERPVFTLDPHFHAGAYYVQEASSMFLAQLAPLFAKEGIKRVLDLCAAPGGKSTLLAELLPQDGILIANEVIRSRVPALAENISKWGYPNVLVTNNDARDFARLPRYFDAIMIDAPCSGEGMFRKDPKAREEWSPALVQLCSERQRRIVADVWEALRPGGYLIYSTCTFNRQENEENVDWICSHLGAETCTVPYHADWGILEREGCYRFLPHRLKGEGFFFAVMQKEASGSTGHSGSLRLSSKTNPLSRQKAPYPWLRDHYGLFAKGEMVKALPVQLAPEMLELENFLRVSQSGVAVARNRGRDWAPEADLALSGILQPDVFPAVELDLATAQRYLRRETFEIPEAPIGYIVVCYEGNDLGFAKNLGGRINNLYPQARRIRMETRPQ